MNLAGIKKKLRSILYERIEDGIFECQLKTAPASSGQKVRQLVLADFQMLAENFDRNKVQDFVTRLSEADGFIYEPQPGVIAGYGWATSKVRTKEGENPFFYRIIPAQGELYVFDFYVKPEYRGKGIASVLMTFILDYGRSKGLSQCFTLHDLNNSAMIKASQAAGLKRSGVITYQRIGLWVKRDTSALKNRN